MEPYAGAGFVTPEAVRLDARTAGLGSRVIAAIIDGLILSVFTFVAVVGMSWLLPEVTWPVGITLVVLLVLFDVVGYFMLFELAMDGQTPGKRQQHLRVTMADGRPVTGTASFIRNLLRLVDVLPTFYLVGSVAILVSRSDQRLGDMAAGTTVVHERAAARPTTLDLSLHPLPAWASQLDIHRVGQAEYQLIRGFLQRRDTLDDEPRRRLAVRIGDTVRPLVEGVPQDAPDEALLTVIAQLVQQRNRGTP